MHVTRRGTTVTLAVVVATGLATRGIAQSPTPSSLPPPSPNPAFSCDPPSSTQVSVDINVVPDGDSCKFEPQTITDLKTYVGWGVDWNFCSTCLIDTKVELAVSDDLGPFKQYFQLFVPTPQTDNLATVTLPSNAVRRAYGRGALKRGYWEKYSVTLKSKQTNAILNQIDPRLEIDDTTLKPTKVPHDTVSPRWVERILMILLGVALGFGAARIMRPKTAK
jgi:hypothetical protein